MSSTSITLTEYLAGFGLHPRLQGHTATVFLALPGEVREPLMADGNFKIMDYEPAEGGFIINVGELGKAPARCVVLKRTLMLRSEEFIHYVIAHELAHAHLKNEGRTPGEDPEYAADALAADWGFPKPANWEWWRR